MCTTGVMRIGDRNYLLFKNKEQLVMNMRRHLTAHHLAWIVERGSDRQDSDT